MDEGTRLRQVKSCTACQQRDPALPTGYDGPVTVVLAEGAILERVLDTAHSIQSEALSRHAYAQFEAAQTRTAWGRRHRRRFALMEGNDVLASTTQCDLAAVLDQRPLRVCGIGSISSAPTERDGGHAQELVARLLETSRGRRSGDGAPVR
jgi:hypothetical protein